jgi:hypothetical protein
MKISREEIEAMQLYPQTLQLAVDLVNVNGYVVLEEVIPNFIDSLYEALHDDAVRLHRGAS